MSQRRAPALVVLPHVVTRRSRAAVRVGARSSTAQVPSCSPHSRARHPSHVLTGRVAESVRTALWSLGRPRRSLSDARDLLRQDAASAADRTARRRRSSVRQTARRASRSTHPHHPSSERHDAVATNSTRRGWRRRCLARSWRSRRRTAAHRAGLGSATGPRRPRGAGTPDRPSEEHVHLLLEEAVARPRCRSGRGSPGCAAPSPRGRTRPPRRPSATARDDGTSSTSTSSPGSVSESPGW